MRHLLFACLLATTAAAGPHRVEVGFAVVTNTGLGRCAAVVGNQPELGSWNPAQSVRLTWHAGNVWSGTVSLSAGAAVEYKFISRDEASGLHCDSNNVHWAGGANGVTNLIAPPAAPYAGKTLFYLSGFTSAVLLHASAGGAFTSTPMARVGDGRFPGESLYRVDGVGTAGEALQFVLWDGGTNYDHAPYAGYGAGPDYFTTLDVSWLQDGQLYSYRPAASVSPPRITETNVASSFAGIPGRRIRIYLPRGYDEHPWKRYPVLYLHDGNNQFSTNCDMCSWQADLTATREISQGRMREAILVGVDNSTNRILEYLPPPDVFSGQPGVADQFANFLVHNVRPTVDFHFRTLNQPAHTLTLGSSMGAVLAAYLGFETNVFGGVGLMSPAFWTAPLLVGRMASNAVHAGRGCIWISGPRSPTHPCGCRAGAPTGCCWTMAMRWAATCCRWWVAGSPTTRPRGPTGCPARCGFCSMCGTSRTGWRWRRIRRRWAGHCSPRRAGGICRTRRCAGCTTHCSGAGSASRAGGRPWPTSARGGCRGPGRAWW
jgi:predicted alpha/beta superfamily hydrolase